MQLVPPVARAVSWSGGLLSMSAGLLSVGAADKPDSDARERRKPAHKRGYMHRYVNEACRAALMRRAIDESRVAMGQEVLFCLHGGNLVGGATGATVGSTTSSATSGDSIWGLGLGATDADVLRGAFTRLAALYPDDALRIHVVYGAADGMVPARGRAWLKGVLEGVGLINTEDGGFGDTEGGGVRDMEGAVDAPMLGAGVWTEAGHDDVLFLEEVVDAIFGRV
ncbi:hypothetical protein C8R44DRAFT_327930 [Mycena epipterygia]|nr:hypothetical protein C8R44DRAFT_327930 [Mycena epipterygia]